MKRTVAILIGAAALMAITVAPASAQTSELAVNFSCQKWNSGFCDAKGIAIDFAHVIHKAPTSATSIFGDFGWNTFTDEEDDTSFVAGLRERFFRTSRFSPYAQVSAGVMHWNETFFNETGNDFLIGGGGGVQVRLTRMFDVKAELNLWGTADQGDWDLITRLTFGGVIKFGKN